MAFPGSGRPAHPVGPGAYQRPADSRWSQPALLERYDPVLPDFGDPGRGFVAHVLPDKGLNTDLHHAVAGADSGAIGQLLYLHGRSGLHTPNTQGVTPLDIAASRGDDFGARVVEEEERRKFIYACSKDLAEARSYMPGKAAWPPTAVGEPHSWVPLGSRTVAEDEEPHSWVRCPASDDECAEALMAAVAGGSLKLATDLMNSMEPGFNASWQNPKTGDTYMHALAKCKPRSQCRSYSAAPVQNGYGWTDSADIDMVFQHLVRERANLHQRNYAMQSPLYASCWYANAHLCRSLLENDADANCWDDKRWKPMHCAIMRKAPECAQLLLEKTFTLAPDALGNNCGQLAASMMFVEAPEMWPIIEQVGVKMKADLANMPPACCSVWEDVDFYSDTWSVDHLRRAVETASVHCAKCAANKVMIEQGYEDIRELTPKVEAAKPIINRGNVQIDFIKKTIEIMKEIPFAARKEPDASAEIEEGHEEAVEEVLLDLAIILATFCTPEAPMVIEGHTGGQGSPYWASLAQNRADKILEIVAKSPMPPGQPELTREEWTKIAIPLGTPGGGAKVIVRPQKRRGEVEEPPEDPKAKGKKK